MNDEEKTDLIPKKQNMFAVSAEDIVDNALQNLDERQAAEVSKKAADEVVKIAVEKRKAEYKNSAAQEEMRNLINNANLLDKSVEDYKINSTFETASGTTNVEIRKSKSLPVNTIIILFVGVIGLFLLLYFLLKI